MSMPEDLFSRELGDFSEEPSQNVWNHVSRRLAWKRFLSFRVGTFNIYYLAAAVASIGYAGLMHAGGAPEASVAVADSVSVMMKDNDADFSAKADQGLRGLPVAADAYTHGEQNHVSALKADADSIKISKNSTSKEKKDGEAAPQKGCPDFSSEFSVASHSGCAPFSPRIANLSRNTDYCQWNLGNGVVSYDQEPVAVYHEPGTYVIQLKTICGTLSKISCDTITVYGRPHAEIAVAHHGTDAVMEARNADANTYVWDFGDGKRASGRKTAHRFSKAGVYEISLAISNGICSDTIGRQIVVRPPECSLVFPNALQAGSMFVPKGDVDELAAYHMQVMTRNGRELFSTSDPRQGWNGYSNGQRMPRGVYVYRVQYEFMNGEKNSSSGSITLL